MFRNVLAPVVLASLFLASAASAAPGMVVLKNGEILDGELLEVVPGDHVTLQSGKGTRVVAWNDLFSLRLASASKNEAAAPMPSPVVAYVPPPLAPAPQMPQIVDAPTTAKQVSGDTYRPRVAFGARAGVISSTGDLLKANGKTFSTTDFVGDGTALQIDAGYHFTPAWTFFGGYEYASFSKGEAAGATENAPSGHALFVGFKANSHPKGPIGFYFEVGAGWRWLRFSDAHTSAVAGGPVPFRVGLGISVVATDRLRLDAITATSVGMLTRFDLPNACVNASSSQCDSVPESNRTFHVFQTLSLAASYDVF